MPNHLSKVNWWDTLKISFKTFHISFYRSSKKIKKCKWCYSSNQCICTWGFWSAWCTWMHKRGQTINIPRWRRGGVVYTWRNIYLMAFQAVRGWRLQWLKIITWLSNKNHICCTSWQLTPIANIMFLVDKLWRHSRSHAPKPLLHGLFAVKLLSL